MLITKGDAISALRPGAHFSINHFSGDRIDGYVHTMPPPTDVQVNIQLRAMQRQEALRLLRIVRDGLLDKADLLLANCRTDQERNALAVYMQDLRDLPQRYTPRLTPHGTLDFSSFVLPDLSRYLQ